MWFLFPFPKTNDFKYFSWPYWPFLFFLSNVCWNIFCIIILSYSYWLCVCIFWIFPLFDICIVNIFPSIWLWLFFFSMVHFKKLKKKTFWVLRLCYTYRFRENCHNIIESWYMSVLLISLSFLFCNFK